jgi:simple sugar transport system permease protein
MVDTITSFLSADIRVAAPILLAALGLIFMERSGVVNIGAEGTMLIGAFTGSLGAYIWGNAWYGVLFTAAISMLVGLVFALIVVTVKANQIVTGIAFNILALGITTTLNRIVFGVGSGSIEIDGFEKIAIPLLSDIPIIGEAVFNQVGLVYIGLLLVPLIFYFLKLTTIGLKIRSVGEHPEAADTAGINVFKVRYGTIIGGSILVGIGGAYLSLGQLNMFSEDMVSGRGFIALAAVIFGKWNPWGALGAALLFGFGDALQIRLQATGSDIPYQFLLMLPYLLTVAALAGLVGRATPPAASGRPYTKS